MPNQDKEKERAYQSAYYRKNRDKILARRKARRAHNNEVQREWYENNREHHIAMVTARKKNEYGGNCVVCGKETYGHTKKEPAPRFCRDHRKEQWLEKTGKKKFPKKWLSEEEREKRRKSWREAQARYRAKLRGATPDEIASIGQSSQGKGRAERELSNRANPSFSRLKHTEGHVRVWMNESQPADTQEVDS